MTSRPSAMSSWRGVDSLPAKPGQASNEFGSARSQLDAQLGSPSRFILQWVSWPSVGQQLIGDIPPLVPAMRPPPPCFSVTASAHHPLPCSVIALAASSGCVCVCGANT